MYKKVKNFIEEYNMIKEKDTIIVGVSGGSDSVALLFFLNKYRNEKNIELKAVHVHHGIRGKEADRDQEFVENLCKCWNISCISYKYDVPQLAKGWKLGLEDTGRRVRKEAFDKEMLKCGGTAKIALAHNKNDVAETFLHNLARGSGLKGMASMKAFSGNIIRPILCLEKKEILKTLQENKISFVTDSSNLSDEYTRNRIRRNILPLMEKEINEQALAHIAKTARIMEEAEAYLEKQGQKELKKYIVDENKVFLRGGYQELDQIIKTYVIADAFELLAGKRKDFTSAHIKKVLELEALQTGKKISLPYHLEAYKAYEGIVICRNKTETECRLKGTEEYILHIEGTMESKYGKFVTRIFPYKEQYIEEKKYTKWFDYDKIKCSLCVRTRKEGDFLFINDQGGRKKINRFMIDEKIPRDDRDNVPLVALENEILWVVGKRINAHYKVSPDTKYILELKYEGGLPDE